MPDFTAEYLSQAERRIITIPDIGEQPIEGSRHHWLALEECLQNGWLTSQIAELAWRDANQQGLDFSFVFLGLIAYIHADGRATLGIPEETDSGLPPLLTGFSTRSS